MATEYNTADSQPGDEIVKAGFDPLEFWDENRQLILLVGGALLLALVAFGWYEYSTSQRIAAAGAALSTAESVDDYRNIADRYAGTAAGGDAALILGGKLRDDHKLDESAQVLQNFIDKYPKHSLLHAGLLSLGETLEAQGKTDDALAKYEEIPAKYPDSYSAPLAALAEANLLKSKGKIDDARRLYENFIAQFPDSVFSQEANAEMQLLRK